MNIRMGIYIERYRLRALSRPAELIAPSIARDYRRQTAAAARALSGGSTRGPSRAEDKIRSKHDGFSKRSRSRTPLRTISLPSAFSSLSLSLSLSLSRSPRRSLPASE